MVLNSFHSNTTVDCLDKSWRPCVGIVLMNLRGQVFAGKRKDGLSDNIWQWPQGGIDEGETAEQAMWRELEEETGVTIKQATIMHVASHWLSYDLPENLRKNFWQGRYKGQIQLWYLLSFSGLDSNIDIMREPIEFSSWEWLDSQFVIKQIISFKRDVYLEVYRQFQPYMDDKTSKCRNSKKTLSEV